MSQSINHFHTFQVCTSLLYRGAWDWPWHYLTSAEYRQYHFSHMLVTIVLTRCRLLWVAFSVRAWWLMPELLQAHSNYSRIAYMLLCFPPAHTGVIQVPREHQSLQTWFKHSCCYMVKASPTSSFYHVVWPTDPWLSALRWLMSILKQGCLHFPCSVMERKMAASLFSWQRAGIHQSSTQSCNLSCLCFCEPIVFIVMQLQVDFLKYLFLFSVLWTLGDRPFQAVVWMCWFPRREVEELSQHFCLVGVSLSTWVLSCLSGRNERGNCHSRVVSSCCFTDLSWHCCLSHV